MPHHHSKREWQEFGILIFLIFSVVVGLTAGWSWAFQKVYNIPENATGIAVWPKKLGFMGNNYKVLEPGDHSINWFGAHAKVFLVKTQSIRVPFEARVLSASGAVAEKFKLKGSFADRLVKPQYVRGELLLELNQDGVAKLARGAKEGSDLKVYFDQQVQKHLIASLRKHQAIWEIREQYRKEVYSTLSEALASEGIGLSELTLASVAQVSLADEKVEGKLVTSAYSVHDEIGSLKFVNRLLWERFFAAFICVTIVTFILGLMFRYCPEPLMGILEIIGEILGALHH